MRMFCYQCQEALNNQGCTAQGVCGKTSEVAKLQDALIYITKGISYWSVKAKEYGISDEEVDLFVAEALFTTITNVNFDPERMMELINRAFNIRDKIKTNFLSIYTSKTGKKFDLNPPDPALWYSDNKDEILSMAEKIGVLSEENEDIRSLKELLIYGLKGICAYVDHAYILKYKNQEILDFVQRALNSTIDDSLTMQDRIQWVLDAGKIAVDTMALLDKANTSTYGNPEPTDVYTGTYEGPAILVSGHDLLDLEEILKQTEGKGINVYTHGEMLPANAYPGLKKYKHLVGNYGGSWATQQKEFNNFNGAIVMTTNCIQKPLDSYKDRIFTTGLVAWPGVAHIPNRLDGNEKDFTPVIEKALEIGGLKEKKGKYIKVGFAHNSILKVADKIINAIQTGKIKRMFVMSGCDGRHKEREYYTNFAKSLPKDTVILTSGCAKYRYNHLDLGEIDGIPRILDAGQCNDSYSLVVVAQKLVEVLKLKDINELPISYNVAWYEQKAVTVLLALLYLGVKKIRLGPTLPAFLSPNVVKVLVENFDIKPITDVQNDMEHMLQGN